MESFSVPENADCKGYQETYNISSNKFESLDAHLEGLYSQVASRPGFRYVYRANGIYDFVSRDDYLYASLCILKGNLVFFCKDKGPICSVVMRFRLCRKLFEQFRSEAIEPFNFCNCFVPSRFFCKSCSWRGLGKNLCRANDRFDCHFLRDIHVPDQPDCL